MAPKVLSQALTSKLCDWPQWWPLDFVEKKVELPKNVVRSVAEVKRFGSPSGPTCVDIFCGLGGLSLGFGKVGFTPALAIELEEAQCATFAANHPRCPVLMGDARKLDVDEIQKALGRVDAVVGGVPCEPFSSARNWGVAAGKVVAEDPRRSLIVWAARLVLALQPRLFCFENVPGTLSHKLWRAAANKLARSGYGVGFWKTRASDHGAATIRQRAFLVGVRGLQGEVPAMQPTARHTAPRKALAGLRPPSDSGADTLHRKPPPLSPRMLSLFRKVKPGQTLVKDTPKGQRQVIGGWVLHPDKPAQSVLASRRPLHWSGRYLTGREIARIQGVPDSYKFPVSEAVACSMLGDMVPVQLGAAVARHLVKCAAKTKRAKRTVKQTEVQTLILSKETFSTVRAATRWVKEHGFKTRFNDKGPDETETSYRFRQRNPGGFQQGSMRTITLTNGVQAVIGRPKQQSSKATVKLLPVQKKDEDRNIVFGVVLEPDEVDAHGDTIDAQTIARAAHLWLARRQDRGLMHRRIINGKVEIYESFIAPAAFTINGQRVKKGTWLLMLHVLDAALWKDIKAGKMTGLSMGGFARKRPMTHKRVRLVRVV